MAVGKERFLPALAAALKLLSSQGGNMHTRDFVMLCEKIMPVFDELGSVFHFARTEFEAKTETLRKVADSLSTLPQVVEHDKQKGTVKVKNSCARNLHRCKTVLDFVQRLLAELVTNHNVHLRDAAAVAYDATLAHVHTYVIRAGVKAGLLLLPTREHFMTGIGETEDSARQHSMECIHSARVVVAELEKLYADCKMPASDVWLWSNH